MLEHPYIDFDGDGHGDQYDAVQYSGGGVEFAHHDSHGHIDALATDLNHDGRIDSLMVDDDHNGTMDRYLADTNGDGIMDTSSPIDSDHQAPQHPYIDFNGDGHGDRYYATNVGHVDDYTHVDGHGHIDALAVDLNQDGLIDQLYVDSNHDGTFDRTLADTTGDGIMDKVVSP